MLNSTVTFSTKRLSITSPPDDSCFDRSLVDRSGEMIVHVCPPLVVRWITCEPTYTVLWSCGEIVIGKVHWKRYFRSFGATPYPASGHGSTARDMRVCRSNVSRPAS